MAYVFRTYKTQSDPATGKRVPMLDAKGRKVPHELWRFQIFDYLGNRLIKTGYASRSETEKLAARIQREQDEIKRGYRPAPKVSDKNSARPIIEGNKRISGLGQITGRLARRSVEQDSL